MASVSFYVQKNTAPAQIYVRFMAFDNDIWGGTTLLVDPKYWDKAKHRLKNTKQYPIAPRINQTLDKLKSSIIDAYTLSQIMGTTIDNIWLRKNILTHFNRPTSEIENIKDNTAIYLTDFMLWWTKEVMPKWRNPKSRKTINSRRQAYFTGFVDRWKSFEAELGYKVRLAKLTPEISERAMVFLQEEKNYGPTTLNKFVARFNFFCERAMENNRIVPHNYKCTYRAEKISDTLEPYLNEAEIQAIYDYNFDDNKRLDNARDNFIIGLCTGLRVSDFLTRLRTDNIGEDYIEIRTQKTNTLVSIPIHWMIGEILKKRFGFLPPKISEQKFNLYIKEICEIVGINKEMEGFLFDRETKRNKLGMYPKHKLVSSHIARRSFATNNFGKIPDNDLQKICGWSSPAMMFHYIKKSSRESATRLKNVWAKEEELKTKKADG